VPLKVYTMDEAAKLLRLSRRFFQDWLRDHPFDEQGRPFYSAMGRRKTFDEDDLRRVREAARREEAERLRGLRNYGRQVVYQPSRPTPISKKQLDEAIRLASEKRSGKKK